MDNLDFRSIKVLLNLYKTRNTYVTAEQLDLSQSAVARTLAKCRQAFNEPLFIRSGNQLTPTAFTEALVDKLPHLLNDLEDIVATRSEFSPAQLTGRYLIYLNRPSQLIYGEHLFELLARDAPNASWYIKGWDSMAVDQLLDDRATIGVNYYSPTLPDSICQDLITEERFVVLAHEDHPLHQLDTVTDRDMEPYGFVSLSIPFIDERNLYIDAFFQDIGVGSNIALQTDSLMLAIRVAESRKLLLAATIDVVNFPQTKLKPINYKISSSHIPDTNVVFCYARKNRNKPMIKWLRSVADEIADYWP